MTSCARVQHPHGPMMHSHASLLFGACPQHPSACSEATYSSLLFGLQLLYRTLHCSSPRSCNSQTACTWLPGHGHPIAFMRPMCDTHDPDNCSELPLLQGAKLTRLPKHQLLLWRHISPADKGRAQLAKSYVEVQPEILASSCTSRLESIKSIKWQLTSALGGLKTIRSSATDQWNQRIRKIRAARP